MMIINLYTPILLVGLPFPTTAVSSSIFTWNTRLVSSSRYTCRIASWWVCFTKLRIVVLLVAHILIYIHCFWVPVRVLWRVADEILILDMYLWWHLLPLRKIGVTRISSVGNIILKRNFLSWLVILLVYSILLYV